jgi:hypothetical protein
LSILDHNIWYHKSQVFDIWSHHLTMEKERKSELADIVKRMDVHSKETSRSMNENPKPNVMIHNSQNIIKLQKYTSCIECQRGAQLQYR